MQIIACPFGLLWWLAFMKTENLFCVKMLDKNRELGRFEAIRF